MIVNCRFSTCKWSGSEDEIFDHLESQHKKFLREPRGHLYFDFSFDDLQQEVFVLCSTNGLYWFRQKMHPTRFDGVDFGVFHIGGSEQVEYQLKLGLKQDGHCEYWGPHTSERDSTGSEGFNLKFDFNYLGMLDKTLPSCRLRLYFGAYDDSEDKICPRPQDMEWKEEDERLNSLCVEIFTCGVCFEYIRRDARFCENQHFICLECFNKMQQRKALKCPTCRGQYLYDCIDQDIERLLRMMKWPDMPQCKLDEEIRELIKKMPGVQFVKLRPGENH